MIVPVLQFNGGCAEAIALYERAFATSGKHAEYYRDAPPDSGLAVNDLTRDRIMHAGMTICGTYVNMNDTEDDRRAENPIVLNVMVTEAEVRRAYEVLSAEGEVVVPLGPQFFSPLYGSVKDRFGVHWQLITCQPEG